LTENKEILKIKDGDITKGYRNQPKKGKARII
jgi:hypothetical protein